MRVLLADDHRLVIEGISNLLQLNGIDVVGIANDGLEAIALAQQLQPDLILMDIRMPRCDGLSATRQIQAAHPEIKIVMLTTSAEDQDLFESVKSGASGYLLKTMRAEAFIAALHDAEQGVPPFSPGLAARLLDEFARMSLLAEQQAPSGAVEKVERRDQERPFARQLAAAGLTERQGEVLRLVARGLTYKEVGRELSISERTVRFHMTKIMDQLHLYNRAQVLAYARKLGLDMLGG
jgi:DNA-binding NarL/FixJ family response regulator